jgi:phage gp45-like
MNHLVKPLATRIANMVARALVKNVDDSLKVQILQLGVLADETREGVERIQNYGFTSVPLEGAEAVALFVGGRQGSRAGDRGRRSALPAEGVGERRSCDVRPDQGASW